MFFSIVKGSLFRQKRKVFLIALTVALGVSLSTAILNVIFDVQDKVNKELKTYGANIRVVPKNASLWDDLYSLNQEDSAKDSPSLGYLKEADIGKIKTIFWAYNIVDFSPYLKAQAHLVHSDDKVTLIGTWFNHALDLPTGESLKTGIVNMKDWWSLQGDWLNDDEKLFVMAGSRLAEKYHWHVGDTLELLVEKQPYRLQIKSIFSSGGEEDDQLYLPLSQVQKMSHNIGLVNSLEVSALTTPENELSRRAAQNPKRLSAKEWETWYCTAYVSAVCYQIDEALSYSISKPIRQFAESEGVILEKIQGLMLVMAFLSLLGSSLGISSLIMTSVIERTREIGLLKAIGAGDWAVIFLILSEVFLSSLIGTFLGYWIGIGLSHIIGESIFHAHIALKPMVIPLVGFSLVFVVLFASIPAIRFLISLKPSQTLRG